MFAARRISLVYLKKIKEIEKNHKNNWKAR